jgi:predicted ATPase/transcriptional regulator with XRE-family HTH domain/Tfp pilus assembly protein PilF
MGASRQWEVGMAGAESDARTAMGGDLPAFGALVRRYRQAAALSQSALAERAGLSTDAISVIERGRRGAPRPETVALLAAALGLDEQKRAAFAAAARALGPAEADAAPAVPGPGPHPLPAALSSFIGREREVAAVRARLGQPGTRLLTLTGAGGMGKTRLALAVAERLPDGYPDGVGLVELAALAEPALLAETVARALGLREEVGRAALQSLTEQLRKRRLLLVLDNCEHLVGACAELATALLRTCPDLRILATSREVLGITGEVIWPVPPLAVPDARATGGHPSLEAVQACEAVQLLLARTRERRPDYALAQRDAAAVAEVVRRLDGLPLAIELAAARLAVLSPGQLAARLDDRFRLLTGGSRSALPRHQTLRAALDWSYELLTEAEQALLRRLAVFAGGATLEAAEVVCGGEEVTAEGVLDLLGGLVAKSLVQVQEREGVARFRLLETVRAYAWERLEASAEATGVARAHAALYLALAEAAEPRLMGSEQATWLAQLEAEHDNLRAALRWATASDEGELGLRLAGALWLFWAIRGHLREGQNWLADLLALDTAHISTTVRAQALNVAGSLAQMRSDYTRARAWHEEALALWRGMGDRKGISRSLNNLGNVAFDQNDHQRARALYEESLALKQEVGDSWGVAAVRTNLANVLAAEGRLHQAQAMYEEAVAQWRAVGDRAGLAQSLSNLAEVLQWQDRLQAAHAVTDEALALRRELADPRGIACSLVNLGRVLRRQGDLERARAALVEALELFRALAGSRDAAACLETMAEVFLEQGEHDRAAHLLAAAEALRLRIGAARLPVERPAHEEMVAAARCALGDGHFGAAWKAGAALSLEEAIAMALDEGTGRPVVAIQVGLSEGCVDEED